MENERNTLEFIKGLVFAMERDIRLEDQIEFTEHMFDLQYYLTQELKGDPKISKLSRAAHAKKISEDILAQFKTITEDHIRNLK